MAIEALLSAAAAVAFLVPGQRRRAGGGLRRPGRDLRRPPELSLGVSLVRRARDIVVGVPILLLWQFIEMRRLRKTAPDVGSPVDAARNRGAARSLRTALSRRHYL